VWIPRSALGIRMRKRIAHGSFGSSQFWLKTCQAHLLQPKCCTLVSQHACITDSELAMVTTTNGASAARHLTTILEEPIQEHPSIIESMREKCATAKHRLTVYDLERMLQEEIISAERRNYREQRHAAKEALQQRARHNSSKDSQFESVLCTSSLHEYKLSKCPSEQKRCRSHWLPTLPRFLQMSTLGKVNRVHPCGMS